MTKLEDRVTKVEREVDEVRRLASGAHEDVADVQAALRAHIGSLEALRKTQLEMDKKMRQGFTEMRAEFADVRTEMRTEFANVRGEMRTEFANVRGEVADLRNEVREGFTTINLGMSQMTALLNTAIGKDTETN